MPVGDEDYSNNVPALGRFKPGYVSGGAGQGELDVTITTNLAGEAIRFTLNESLDNIVSSGTLTMLNAILGDEGEVQVGVMGEVKIEEDEAQWGTLYDSAPVEPNQLVTVTEAGGGLGSCTTYWRVVSVTSYLDESDIPYYDVQLESMAQAAINCKFDPSKAGSTHDFLWIADKDYWEGWLESWQEQALNNNYQTEEDNLELQTEGARLIVETPSEWLAPFLAQIAEVGLEVGGAVDIGDYIPAFRTYLEGESCWGVIEDMFGFAGKMARFTRDKKMVVIDLVSGEEGGENVWSYMPTGVSDDGTPIYDQEDIDNPPLQPTDIGNFGQGLQLTYSKEGVYNWAKVIGQINGEETFVKVPSEAGDNILNGENILLVVNISEDYNLTTILMLENYGKKELYKSVISARSATYDNDKIPLSVEVGMTVSGSSKLGGATSIFITGLNRTTDAQQNKITTGISGTRVFSSSSEAGNNMGWQ